MSFFGILEFLVYKRKKPLGNSRILCDEIIWSSRGMPQGLGILEFVLGILELPVNSLGNFRICLGNSRTPSKFSWEF